MAKKVRMLVDLEVDGVKYRPNNVVVFPDALGKHILDAGQADDSKAAVAYAESQGAKPITHESAAAAQARAAVEKLEAELAEARKQRKAESDAEKRAAVDRRIAELKKAIEAAEAELDKA